MLFGGIFPQRGRACRASRRYARAVAGLRRPLFESLEPRVLLSCVVTQVGNTLSIVGNAESDFVQIVDMGAGNVSVGCSSAPGPVKATTYKGVAHLKIDTGAGDDTVTLVGQGGGGGGGALFDVFADVSLNTGAGADTVSVSYLKIKGDVSITASLGDGADSFQMDVSEVLATASATIATSSLHAVKLSLDTGAGNDTARCSLFDAFSTVSATMGAGNDSFTMKHRGELHLTADMGDGNDTFSASADGSFSNTAGTPPPFASSIFLKYTGGLGNDSAKLSFFDVFTDVSLDQGAGNDDTYLKYELSASNAFAPPAGVAADCRLSLVGGDGNDTATLITNCPYMPTARACVLSLDMGAGSDSVQLDSATTGTPSAQVQASSIYIKLDGGAGNDTARLNFFDVFTGVSSDMGAGSDALYLKLDGIKGESLVNSSLGAGNDTFSLTANSSADHKGYVAPVGTSPDALFIKIDGGDGNDSISTDCTDVFCDSSVDGGAGSDRIFQKVTLSDIVTAAAPLDMQADGSVRVLGGDGNDSVLIGLLLPAVQVSRQVVVAADLGAGSDQFTCSASGATAAKQFQKVEIHVACGDGNDSTSMSFFDVFADVALDGGNGNDSAFLKFDGIKGDCAVSADMGAGSDVFDVSANSSVTHPGYTPPAAQTLNFSKITFKYDGGAGNDTCRLALTDVVSTAALDGGDGNDTFVVRDTLTDKFENGQIPDQTDFTLQLNAGAGADSVLLALLTPNVARDHTMSVAVDLGAGSDTFSATASSPPSASNAEFLKLRLSGGDGNDSASMAFTDVFSDCTLDMGAGNDSVSYKHADIKGESSFACDMGAGSDTFVATASNSLSSPNGTTAPPAASALFIKYDGGAGNDVASVSTTDVFTNFSADMGSGNNRVFAKVEIHNTLVSRPSDLSSDVHIGVTGGDGADNVLIDLVMPAQATPRQASVDVDCGGGADVFQMNATGIPNTTDPTALAAKVFLKLDMGAGSDRAQVAMTDVFSDVSTTMGDGNDRYFLKYKGEIGESVSVADMGAGNDLFDLSAQSTIDPAQSSSAANGLFIKFDGIGGADTTRMSFFDVFCDVSADLGTGNDSFTIKQQLSADAALPPDMASASALNVTGGDGNDSVLIGLLLPAVQTSPLAPAANVRVDLGNGNNSVQLTCDSSTPLATTSGGGLSVEVACGTGNNNVSVQVGSPQSSPAQLHDFGSVSLAVTCDGGNNTVNLATFASFAKGEVCDDGATTGDGTDNITVSNTFGLCDGSVRVVVDSGDGVDKVLAVATGDVNGDGALDMVVDGGAGNDNVAIRESPTKASLGRVSLEVDGGTGDDTLTLVSTDASGANGTPSNVSALVDGGDGYDVAFVSPVVQTLDVEEVHPPL